ncbi:CCA tRNA nucleotidyltransferase [Bacillus sp. AFS031507]|uniref:CCA tRNA nucleotidyltransferase n=1 Tax=Bacillus sp. AFS031507 TaxID=2033496 RepID=UPI000BFE84BB|nr:CCA tRNA nucleotidyltransferase [Bacillus sp. AFS031507]PGY14030.1 CCA tRNA nucleotidyltransferase [Bacillus sp. AFS031507]
MIDPFLAASPVLKKLEDAGFEAYFVGGSVRDYLLKREINDVDIATSATPEEVKRIFPKTVDIGIEHGTVLVLVNNGGYEITTFRTESDYQDFRRPKEVTFIRNLKEDLQRRDFTMNAIAMDRNRKLIDPFNGFIAIQDRIIQTVGSPNDRFQEDALRMMRAVRFVSQLSFQIERGTVQALAKLVHLLDNIAVERKRAEFEKLLIGKNKTKALSILLEANIYSYLPGLKGKKQQLEELRSFNSGNLNKSEMWSLLIFCINLKEKEIELFLKEWRLALKEIREIQQVVHFLAKRLEQDWSIYDLYSAGHDHILSTEKLYYVINGINEVQSIEHWINLYETLPIKDRSEMNVTGNDVMDWFNKRGGPWLKETLLTIEENILAGNLDNDKEKIKEWLMKCNQK